MPDICDIFTLLEMAWIHQLELTVDGLCPIPIVWPSQ
jgi:hypothetical protein